MSTRSKGWIATGVIFFVLIVDQLLKIWVKTNMTLHESKHITDWFYIYFIENNGMAFGLELFDKFFLTSLRIVASGFLIWYLHRICRKPEIRLGYCITIALIIAGAIGNVIDCLFYGMIFNDSMGQVATLFPAEGGYGTFFYGKVVDMLYFPLIDTYWPDWVPFVGGDHFLFFRPIFNLADSAITCSVFLLLLFYRKDLSDLNDLSRSKATAKEEEKETVDD
jgi:signal peptidase II